MTVDLMIELNMECLMLAHEYNNNYSPEELFKRAKTLTEFLITMPRLSENDDLIAKSNMKCLWLAHQYNGNRSFEELLSRAKYISAFLSNRHVLKP